MRRPWFALVPLTFAVLAAEAGLRAVYPVLPSLEGLRGDPTQPAAAFGKRFGACMQLDLPPTDQRSWEVVALGDSVTAGAGILRKHAWPNALSASLGVPITTVAEPGAELCRAMDLLQERIVATGWPRMVIWELFADDLGPYLVYSQDGRKIVYPEAEHNAAIRQAVTQSYLLNALWFTYRSNRGAGTNRVLDPRLQAEMRERLRSLLERLAEADVIVIPFLLEPVGITSCRAGVPADQPCGWMPADLDTLDVLFRQLGAPPADLRGLWSSGVDHSLPFERQESWRGGMTIHPDAAGHTRIAEALLPIVQARRGDTAAAR